MRVSRPEWHHSASCKPGSSGLTDRELRLDAAEFRDFRHSSAHSVRAYPAPFEIESWLLKEIFLAIPVPRVIMLCLDVVGRLDEGQPGRPGGSLTSKPTWSNTSGCSTTSAFFPGTGRSDGNRRKSIGDGQRADRETTTYVKSQSPLPSWFFSGRRAVQGGAGFLIHRFRVHWRGVGVPHFWLRSSHREMVYGRPKRGGLASNPLSQSACERSARKSTGRRAALSSPPSSGCRREPG